MTNNIQFNTIEDMQKFVDLYNAMYEITENISKVKIENTVQLLTIEDVMKITHWGKHKVEELFNDPELAVIHLGKSKQVEASVLKKYFSVKRNYETSVYWRNIHKQQLN
jgi:hypothetical protein